MAFLTFLYLGILALGIFVIIIPVIATLLGMIISNKKSSYSYALYVSFISSFAGVAMLIVYSNIYTCNNDLEGICGFFVGFGKVYPAAMMTVILTALGLYIGKLIRNKILL